jgi:hypothetical protein
MTGVPNKRGLRKSVRSSVLAIKKASKIDLVFQFDLFMQRMEE